ALVGPRRSVHGHCLPCWLETPGGRPPRFNRGPVCRGASLFRHAFQRPSSVARPEAPFLLPAATANVARHHRAHPLRRPANRALGAASRQVEMGIMRPVGPMVVSAVPLSPSLPVPPVPLIYCLLPGLIAIEPSRHIGHSSGL